MSGVRIPPPRPYLLTEATEEVGETFGFASGRLPEPDLMVAVAHQVEHRIVAPEVAGSRPVSHPTSFSKHMAALLARGRSKTQFCAAL